MCWLLVILCAVLSVAAAAVPSFACTTVLVGKDASATGEVLVGHNEDSGGRYVMKTHIVPAAAHVAAVPFEPETALPDPSRERPKLFWSEARPFITDGGASFCDLYVNGYGVVLCSDNCGKSREDRPDLTDGGIGYGIRRLTAERARSAYDAVETAGKLVDQYGYIGSGRSYHFADKNEIWVFQVVNGKHYAVKRVEDDEIYVNPNHYTIRQPDPRAPGFENLLSYAVRRGWHDPRQGEFDFARSYQAPDSYRAVRNVHRHRRGLEILLERDVPETDLPFSVKHTRKIGVEDIKKVLRCHFENTPQDVSGGDTPHFMRTRPMCVSTTLESTVVQIRENHDMTLIWRALGRPCLTPYSPWYFGIAKVPDGYAGDPEEAVKTHFAVPAADLDYSKDEAWFHYTDLQAAVDPLYGEKAAEIKAAVAEFEDTLRSEVRYFEPLAQEHFNRDPEKARGLLTGSVADWSARTLQKLDELYAKAGVLAVELPREIDAGAGAEKFFSVQVAVDDAGFAAGNLVPAKILLGPHYVPPSKWSRAVSVEGSEEEEGKLRLSFTVGEWAKNSAPCLTDMWLILENEEGRRLVGKGLTVLKRVPHLKTDESCDCA
ncbi:MAG: C69 family dipeptidase [Synergistaceae bacterium]|jgi:dipeptidase|nr:C69 family dipeptidase [Synergistaceae bacterium]